VADDIELTSVAGGTRLRVRVKAGARKSGIGGARAGALKVSVAAVAERGKANRALVEVLATALGLPASGVTIVSGKASQDKVVVVALGVATVCARLADLEPPKRR
jgi:uncharacterized protein (TIGR00251 family)